MNKPVDPNQFDISALAGPGPAPADDLYHGVHKGEWQPVVEEAPATTLLYARRGGQFWEPITVSGGLTVTEVIPDIATAGLQVALPAVVYGSGFTATTKVLWNGVEIPNTFLSADELGITIDTTMGVAPSAATITVQDGATAGTGAAGFVFVPPSAGVDYGIGLTQQPGTDPGDPPIVHLQPAGDGPPTLGGVYVIDRVRNNTEGLELGADGRLRVPPATDALLGGILEPPPDDKGYVRRRTPAGVSAWVPPADTQAHYIQDDPPTQPVPPNSVWWDSDSGKLYIWYNDGTSSQWVEIGGGTPETTDYGTGLSKDETAVPPIVHLTPAGEAPQFLGGVYVVDRNRSLLSGLELATDGQLKAPPATDTLVGTLIEPKRDGLAYSRQFDTTTQQWGWVEALTAGLQITSIIPDKAIWGPTEPTPLVVHAYGSEFTPTTVAVLDGNDVATTVVSTTELTFELNPRVPIADSTHIVTVRDPAAVPPALAVGLGAEQFDFMKATTQVDYGLGLSLDTTPTPPMVNLQPAGDSPATLGGVYVVDRVRNNTEGLELGADGRLRVPQATDALLGGILEPPPDDKGYVRRRTAAGVSAWVPPSDTQTDYGVGLSESPGTDPGDPPIVNLQPAGDSPATLGGVYVIDRVRNNTEGLELGADGRLRVPQATDSLLGGILEPPDDGKGYVRRREAGVSAWVPPADTKIFIAGDTAAEVGVVWVPDAQGLSLQPDGRLSLLPTTPTQLGGIVDAPFSPPAGPKKKYARSDAAWVEQVDTADIQYGIGLLDRRPTGQNVVDLKIANTNGEIGGVRTVGRGPTNGLEFDQSTGLITAPPATENAVGVIKDVPADRAFYARTNPGQGGTWVQVDPGGTSNYVFGTGIDRTGNRVDLQIAGTAQQIGGVITVGRSPENGMEFNLATGLITVPLATDVAAGSIVEPKKNDTAVYGRKYTAAGVRSWEPIVGATPYTFGVGLLHLPGSFHVDLKYAGQNGEIGGVKVVGRSPVNGLEFDVTSHVLTAPLATDVAAGSIVEPKPDDKKYVRTRTAAGVSSWVETTATSPRIAGNAPNEIGVVYVPNTRGIVLQNDGAIFLAPPTPDQMGGFVDSPWDGKIYARKDAKWEEVVASAVLVADTPPANPPANALWWESDSGGLFLWYNDGTSSQWVQVNGSSTGVFVGDDPPPTPTANQLWWDSNAGSLNLWYKDADSEQWVQVAGGPQPPGIAEAPIDGTAYARQDANWTAVTALSATPGDVKSGFQTADHAGWIKLDGRAVSTLTATQQAEAALLGFTTNLPNGDKCSLRMDPGAAPGVVGGSAKITQANLPNVTLTSANKTGLVTSPGGEHDVVSPNSSHEMTINTASGIFSIDEGVMVTIPAHTHTIPDHNHTVPLGGTATDYYAKAIVVNFFVYLGA